MMEDMFRAGCRLALRISPCTGKGGLEEQDFINADIAEHGQGTDRSWLLNSTTVGLLVTCMLGRVDPLFLHLRTLLWVWVIIFLKKETSEKCGCLEFRGKGHQGRF